jgi:hypothetical protein
MARSAWHQFTMAISFFHREHQKSGTIACGIGGADWPGKKEFGFSAHLTSLSGPSSPLANCVRRSMGTLRTAASYCR